MTKNIHSIMRLLTSIVLTSILCIGLTLPALAVGGPIVEGTEGKQAETAITKLLKMPAETTTPNATFNFLFKKESVNESNSVADLATMPEITGVSVTFANTDAGNTDENGLKSVYKETNSVFDEVEWKHAGVYVYTVTEEENTYALTTADDVSEEMSYSPASYEVSVYVKEGTDGKLYIAAIGAKIKVKDDSNTGKENDKVDPTPGDPDVEGSHSDIIFTNVYMKNNDGTDPEGNSVLSISNTLDNDYADKSKMFEFKVTVSNPATVNNPDKTYMAYVLDKDGKIITSPAHVSSSYIKTDANNRQYIEFTHNAALTVFLLHGQKLSFVGLPVGAIYQVTNEAHTDYTPSYMILLNDVVKDSATGLVSSPLSTNKRFVGEVKNEANFTNRYKVVTEMGISVDDIPYIALISIILIVVAVYINVKSRRDTKKD